MTKERIAKILDDHGIPWYICDDRIKADSMISWTATFEFVEDVTDWSRRDLYDWLGYDFSWWD